jgi:hypothetical protein
VGAKVPTQHRPFLERLDRQRPAAMKPGFALLVDGPAETRAAVFPFAEHVDLIPSLDSSRNGIGT